MAIKNYTSGVDVYTSLGEIQGALAAHGARQIMVEYAKYSSGKKSRQTWHRRSVQAGATSGTGCWRKWRSSRPVW